jgi:FlaA1/EpsC-like NDP-sugar epimerase
MPASFYFLFHLYEAKWRFASLPDLMNIVRASTVLAVSLLVLDYALLAPNVFGHFFFGKITILLLLDPADGVSGGGTDRLSLFPLHPRAASCPR